jgi:hypothetical protein
MVVWPERGGEAIGRRRPEPHALISARAPPPWPSSIEEEGSAFPANPMNVDSTQNGATSAARKNQPSGPSSLRSITC